MRLSTTRILVASPDPGTRAMAAEKLAERGMVIPAVDGLDAMEKTYREGPDLVILDADMPRMNGYQTCRMLKLDDQTSSIPVVMLLANGQRSIRHWDLHAGPDATLVLDDPEDGLLQAIARATGVSRKGSAKGRARAADPGSTVDLLTRLNEVLDRKLYEATALGEVSRLAWSRPEPDRTAAELISLLARLFEFRLACMLIHGEQRPGPELIWLLRQPLPAHILAECETQVVLHIAGRTGSVIDRKSIQRRVVVAPGSAPGDQNRWSAGLDIPQMVPIGPADREAGIFALWGAEQGVESADSLRFLGTLANAAFVVLDNARLYQEMRKLAATDELTGLANYRSLQETLEREFHRSVRTSSPLSLIMMDLDDFKLVNDTFGHKRGDQVLQAVASALAGSARAYDVVARYGGEEFAVVLPSTPAEGAAEVAERIRLLVRSVAGRAGLRTLSASVGLATFPDGRIADPSGLVRAADAALYRAKESGKDRVCLSS